ncbi:ECs_2282 family putative zinc-binding protein [Pseudomonas sp. JR33AA]|uniref:ECs_2282 family putative zinc-binding protein n=1 Tax=Pseudomonas sp. JR33AA TaxID=2899113 RepID=UPI003FA3B167
MSRTDRLDSFSISCPRCGKSPFDLSDSSATTFGDLVGCRCRGCDHEFTGDDIRTALKSAADTLREDRLGNHERP